MKVHLNRRYRFSASHRLHNPALGDEQNRAIYGKCNNPFGHGHNYIVEVTVSGAIHPVTGMICDLAELDGYMQRAVIERFEASNLNLQPAFAVTIPTTEALCKYIFQDVQAGFTGATLERIRIEETGNNAFEYSGGKAVEGPQ